MDRNSLLQHYDADTVSKAETIIKTFGQNRATAWANEAKAWIEATLGTQTTEQLAEQYLAELEAITEGRVKKQKKLKGGNPLSKLANFGWNLGMKSLIRIVAVILLIGGVLVGGTVAVQKWEEEQIRKADEAAYYEDSGSFPY